MTSAELLRGVSTEELRAIQLFFEREAAKVPAGIHTSDALCAAVFDLIAEGRESGAFSRVKPVQSVDQMEANEALLTALAGGSP